MCARHSTTLAAMLSAVLVLPVAAQEQAKEDPEDFFRDVIGAMFHSSWNVELHGGYTNNGRLILQRAVTPGGLVGERSLRGTGGVNLGLNVGVNLLLRTGVRAGYTYASNELGFRTDIGNGSEIFDVDDLGRLRSHTIALEIVRYILPARSNLTPYASVGVLGTWWQLDSETAVLDGGDTQFRFGRIGSVGLKYRMSNRIDLQLEWASASVRSPFTGRDSYRVLDGVTIDEETRVSKRDLRFGVLYHFGNPPAAKANVTNDGRK